MRLAVAREFAAVEKLRVVMTLDARLKPEAGPWTIVRVARGEEAKTFDSLVAQVDATILIAPETGGILNERARRIECLGARSLGSSPGAIALCGDKALLAQHLREREIPTPETRVIMLDSGLPTDFPYPAVLKPRAGAGCLHTFAVGRPDQVPALAHDCHDAILQPYLPGIAISVSLLVGLRQQSYLVGVGRQNIEIVRQQFRYAGGTVPLIPEPPVAALARRAVASVAGLRGWVGVDLIWDPRNESASVLEINPRVTTSFVGYQHLVPAGTLARAWLSAIDASLDPTTNDLSETIRRAPAARFSADGTIMAAEPHA
jgi:predicted ATP-grasp superfamily ATP-dependent carboligase